MRAKEFLTEYRSKMFRYIKSVLPKWPDYVLKDWIYGLARGNHPQPAGVPAFNKENILAQIEYEGLSPDTEWKFVPNMKFTLDMFKPTTKKWLLSRLGGNQEQIHHTARERDKKRHITQAQLAKKEGGVRKEPVLLIKHNDGYLIREGWHRTVQHFDMYPDGYTGPAYVAVAQGQQGVAEERLVELGKFKLDYKRLNGHPDRIVFGADDIPVKVEFLIENFGKQIDIIFSVNNRLSMTGAGNQFRIFSHVLNVIREQIKDVVRKNTTRITFSSEAKEESRTSLYARSAPLITKIFKKQLGDEWEFAGMKSDGNRYYDFVWERKNTEER